MQAVILVNKDRKQVAKAVIEKTVFSIGRDKSQDLCLEGKEVSREHAVVRIVGGGFEVENISRNGSLFNGQPLTLITPLKDGDIIQIGPYELRFVGGSVASASSEDADHEAEATRFVGAPEIAEKIKEAKLEKKIDKKAAATPGTPAGNLQYMLLCTSGSIKGNKYKDWRGELTLGRGLENNVVTPDDAISVNQARIVRQGDEFFIEDASTSDHSNGVFLDGYRIKREKLLSGGKIRMGNTHFVFTCVDIGKKKKVRRTAIIATVVFVLLAVAAKLLMPKDEVPDLLAKARQQLDQGKFADAVKTCDAIIAKHPGEPRVDPIRQEADKRIQLADLFAKAQAGAEKEQFDSALETCYAIFRIDAGNQKAKELEQVIKSISEARIALSARNWDDATRLLEKAAIAYPSSGLLKKLLEKARSEQSAATKISSARAQLSQQQYPAARDILATIPADSTYFPEASDLLKGLDRDVSLGKISEEAAQFYKAGKTAEALAAADRGLAMVAGDAALVALKQKIGILTPLIDKMRNAAPLLSSDDVAGILLATETCSDIQKVEQDKTNALNSEAVQAADRFRARLKEIAQQSSAEGDAKSQAGDRKAALVAYMRAAKADPNDAHIKEQATTLRRQVTEESQKYYREGKSLIELGMKKEATASFQKVMDTALPEDDYYLRAKEELRSVH